MFSQQRKLRESWCWNCTILYENCTNFIPKSRFFFHLGLKKVTLARKKKWHFTYIVCYNYNEYIPQCFFPNDNEYNCLNSIKYIFSIFRLSLADIESMDKWRQWCQPRLSSWQRFHWFKWRKIHWPRKYKSSSEEIAICTSWSQR